MQIDEIGNSFADHVVVLDVTLDVHCNLPDSLEVGKCFRLSLNKELDLSIVFGPFLDRF